MQSRKHFFILNQSKNVQLEGLFKIHFSQTKTINKKNLINRFILSAMMSIAWRIALSNRKFPNYMKLTQISTINSCPRLENSFAFYIILQI